MKYTQKTVINMILFFSIISLLLFSCNDNNTQKSTIMGVDKIVVSVLDASIKDGSISITLDINNRDSIDYYMMYSYKGDLDKRDFPSIEKKGNNLSVDFKPFYSEEVSKYYIEHKDDDPFVSTGDEIGLQKIKPKEKRIINLNFTFNQSNIDNLDLSLYFGKYLERESLSEEEIFYIPPTEEFYILFSFKEKMVKIF